MLGLKKVHAISYRKKFETYDQRRLREIPMNGRVGQHKQLCWGARTTFTKANLHLRGGQSAKSLT